MPVMFRSTPQTEREDFLRFEVKRATYFAALMVMPYPIDKEEAKKLALRLRVHPVQIVSELDSLHHIKAQIVLMDTENERAYYMSDGSNGHKIA